MVRGKTIQSVVCRCAIVSALGIALVAAEAFAKDGQPVREYGGDAVAVEVTAISPLGGTTYRIEISLTNKSSEGVYLRNFEKKFFLQTDTGWRPLQSADPQGASATAKRYLPAGAGQRIDSLVDIPLHMPDTFRTYEGDISLLFACSVQSAMRPDAEVRRKDCEFYYWVTPMTDKWIHREGM
ncbi:MAG: hypothetical protein K8I29_02510 [Alphaproteobacteria bacterium]|uniref:DUF4352 domain-containing protein n=1 Tax=Candidatus Nitrobium versatile TaxID=2884831 RepID=A0A953M0E1_9BACT|nr:hypothetical protein [Candidatus Nitrobium versatile]